MKTDLQIAQEAVMEPIGKVAETLGIREDDLELYGKYKAKLSEEYLDSLKQRPDGKLILVTAINPTPAGEGKTTTSVGLGQAFGKLGKKAVVALREPSLEGPLAPQASHAHSAVLETWNTDSALLWHQGRRRGRGIRPGRPHGGAESPLYGGFPCHHFRQQPAGGAFGQPYPAGE